MAPRGRRTPVKLVTALALLAGSLAGASSAPATTLKDPSQILAEQISLDPSLPATLAAGPAPVMFAFDKRATSREALTSYLRANDMDAVLLNGVSVGFACAGSMADVFTLGSAPGARSVWGNHAMTTATARSVPAAFNGSPGAIWNGKGYTGKGVGLAVLDTGLDATHPDLEFGRRTKKNVRVLLSDREIVGPYSDPCTGNWYTEDVNRNAKDLTGLDVQNLEDTETISGHGTHIAGVAAGDGTASSGTYRGMAPDAVLVGVGVTDAVGITQPITDPTTGVEASRPSTMGAVAGFSYVLVRALEGPVTTKVILAGWAQDDLYDPWHPIAASIRDAADFGISVVLPAGNEGPQQSDCTDTDTCRFNTWGASPYAITVAAGPHASRLRVEDYSSRGDPTTYHFHDETFRYQPFLTAPGSNVISTRRLGTAGYARLPGGNTANVEDPKSLRHETQDPEYQMLTGTSVAAAHVAGAIALMQEAAVKAKGCYLTPAQVRSILEQTSTPIPGTTQVETGAGMIDATQAVLMAEWFPKITSIESWMCPPAA